MRQDNGGEERACGQGGFEESEATGVRMEDVLGVNRQQTGCAPQQNGKQVEGNDPGDDPVGEDETKTGDEAGQRDRLALTDNPVIGDEGDQESADAGGGGVQSIDGGGAAGEGNQEAARGRPRYGREVEAPGAPGNRAWKLCPGDQRWEKR